MSISKGTNSISNIRLGTNEISKIYKGRDVVFNRDAPVWMYLNRNGIWYSLDGEHYTKLSTAIEKPYGLFYLGGKFALARYDHNNLLLYNLEKLREGTLLVESTQFHLGYNFWCGDTNRVDVMALRVDNANTSDLTYSLNGGSTWAGRSISYNIFGMRYIGENKFYLYTDNLVSGDIHKGHYQYWKSTNPTTWYNSNYSLPDGTTVDANNWCYDLWACNNKRIYVSDEVHNKTYYGSYTRAEGVVNAPVHLGYYTYIYGKYYAIAATKPIDGGGTAFGSSNQLFVSNDGITFTEVKNGSYPFFQTTSSADERGGRCSQLFKFNGKLCFATSRAVGYITPDYVMHKTVVDNYNNTADGFVICNKLPRF